MKSIAIFCASASGENSVYTETAYQVGQYLAKENYQVVYGGASVGCMGAVAQGALDHGGEVIGVLPRFLNRRELAKKNLTELIMVDSMHERKLKMNELSDASISLPGGFGTMEEFFEIITWGQLGLHQKPTAILNVNGYYNQLIKFVQHMNQESLLKDKYMEMILVDNQIDQLISKMKRYKHPDLEKWLTSKNT